MSCSNGCEKPGSGIYAGNDSCGIQTASRKAQELAKEKGGTVGYLPETAPGVPFISNKVNIETMVPVIPILSGAASLIGGGYSAKVARGETVEPAKTAVGKLIGGITGRNKAAELSAQSSGPIEGQVSKNLQRQGVPVSGNVAFGQASQAPILKALLIVAATAVSFFYFNRNKKRRRR